MGWSRMVLYGTVWGRACVWGGVEWLALCVSNHCVLYSALNSIPIFIINSLLCTFHTALYILNYLLYCISYTAFYIKFTTYLILY